MAYECIDAHHHLWRYRPEEYSWMGDDMDVLRRDHLTAELEEVTREAGVSGTVVVQARQTTQEMEWLSGLAASSDLIRGVVGWAPLTSPEAARELERLASLPKVKGIRHVLHDEPDPFYMLRDDFNRGIALLKDYGLRYDVLIFESHLPQTIEFVDRHPNQIFIVDHIAKPRIRDRQLSPWRERLRELALRPNVYCKISGMVTEAKWDCWKVEDLTPYFETVFEAFTPRRTMFGSDWPVMTLASTYSAWVELVKRTISTFSQEEQKSVLAGTAVEVYQLPVL
jgi:L-fuconolactonase